MVFWDVIQCSPVNGHKCVTAHTAYTFCHSVPPNFGNLIPDYFSYHDRIYGSRGVVPHIILTQGGVESSVWGTSRFYPGCDSPPLSATFNFCYIFCSCDTVVGMMSNFQAVKQMDRGSIPGRARDFPLSCISQGISALTHPPFHYPRLQWLTLKLKLSTTGSVITPNYGHVINYAVEQSFGRSYVHLDNLFYWNCCFL
jgi:hypothetical protein